MWGNCSYAHVEEPLKIPSTSRADLHTHVALAHETSGRGDCSMTAGIQTWLTRVYTYPAYLIFSSYAALPAPVREEADQIQSLWNAMVKAYEEAHRQQETLQKQFDQAARDEKIPGHGILPTADPLAYIEQYTGREGYLEDPTLQAISSTYRTAKQEYDTCHDSSRLLYRPYPEHMREALAQVTKRLHNTLLHLARTSALPPAHSTAVLDRMKATIRRIPTGGLPPRSETAPPTSLFFTHDFSRQGIRIPPLTHSGTNQSSQVFANNRRFALSTVSQLAEDADLGERSQRDLARTEGAFFVRNVPIPFEIIFIPLLPVDAILKQVSLIGSQQQPLTGADAAGANARLRSDTTWQWHLQFTLLVPPPQQQQPKKYGMIALDFDHRLVKTAPPLVRVGGWVSDTGKQESIFFPARVLNNLTAARETREALKLHDLAIKQIIAHCPSGVQVADLVKEQLRSDLPVSGKRLRRLAQQVADHTESGLIACVVQQMLDRTRDLRIDVVRRRRQWQRDRAKFYDTLAHRLSREAGTIVLTMTTRRDRSYTRASITSNHMHTPLPLATAHHLNMQEFVKRLQHAAPIYRTTLHYVQSIHALIA